MCLDDFTASKTRCTCGLANRLKNCFYLPSTQLLDRCHLFIQLCNDVLQACKLNHKQDHALAGNQISTNIAPCTYYDSDSNNCCRYRTGDVKFPKRDSGFTTLVQHSSPLSTPGVVAAVKVAVVVIHPLPFWPHDDDGPRHTHTHAHCLPALHQYQEVLCVCILIV